MASLNFAPYSDPPDAPSSSRTPFLTNNKRPAWFASPSTTSAYHSGGGLHSTTYGGTESDAWETRFGWRIDVESAATYVGGMFTAVALLIVETHSSHVRFHAYQSLLLNIFVLLFHVFCLLILPKWFQYLLIPPDILLFLYLARRAFRESPDLEKFRLPIIGDLAEQWVDDE